MLRQLWTAFVPPLAAVVAVTAAPAAAHAADDGPAARPLPLERLFDNRAVAGSGEPVRSGFDGAGNALAARDLSAAGWHPGRRLDLDAAVLRAPGARPGRPDNVRADGQRVAVRGTGTALSFLVAATSPDRPGPGVTGRGTLTYRDGSHGTYTLHAPDWRAGPAATKAVALPRLITRTGDPREERTMLYAVTVPLREGKPLASVRLPRDPGPDADLHVFSIGVRPRAAGWTGSWAASPSGYQAVGPWTDRTLRLVVHASAGGPRARVRLENTFARGPVRVGAASLAVRAEGAAARGRPVALTFGGRRGVTLAAGERAVSDPARLSVPPDTDLLVSIHLPGPVAAAPTHAAALQRSYLSADGVGDRTGEPGGASFTGSLSVWPFLTGVDVSGGPGSVVALGDSITDGVRSTEGANRRWPDVLARRLLDAPHLPSYGVLNAGISANRVVTDRYPGDGVSTDTGGVSAGHRLERDVLAQTNVRTVVLFEGINDVRWGTPAPKVVAGMRSLAERARARGLRVVAATITPCGGYADCTPEVEARRAAVNAFLRDGDGGGAFDAVLDFDAVLRDPQRPDRIRPAYDSGDHLHPGDAGLAALGASVDLARLLG